MVFLPNLGVNLLSCLCDVARYISAQELDFLDLEQKSSSVNWKRWVSNSEMSNPLRLSFPAVKNLLRMV